MATMLQLQDPEGRPWQPKFKRRLPIRIHQVYAEATYDPLQQGGGGFARFLAEQQRRYGFEYDDDDITSQDDNDNPLKNTTILTLLSIRRKSKLAMFLLLLVEISRVDICYMLPVGLIVYSVALQVAWEQWTIEVEQQQVYQEHLKKIWRDVMEARDRIDFENVVTKDRWHVDLVPEFREESSQYVLWSVPKCRVREPAVVEEQEEEDKDYEADEIEEEDDSNEEENDGENEEEDDGENEEEHG